MARLPFWLAASMLMFLTVLSFACNRSDGKGDNGDQPKKANAATTQGAAKGADEVKLPLEAIAHYGIKIEKARKHVLVPTFVAPAHVSFNQEAMAQVGSPIPGRVVEIAVRLGDEVKKGEPLLTVESMELGEAQSDYLQKRTSLAVAETALDPLKQTWDRAKKLFEETQGISLTEMQKRESEYRAALGAVQSAKGALAGAENKLRLLGMEAAAIEQLIKSGALQPRFAVRAPIGGRIVGRDVTLGQNASPDKDALLVIADTSTFWVLADVPETKLTELSQGAKATITLPGGTNEIEGEVAFISSQLNENTRTVPVRIMIKNDRPELGLRQGMFARAEIAVAKGEAGEAVLAIPEAAVITVKGRPSVFVPDDEENTFRVRPVVVGRSVGGLMPVIAGLKERKEFVSSGAFVLKAELGKAQTDND